MQMAESSQDVRKEVKELKDEAYKAKSVGDKVLYLALLQLLAPLQAKEERLAGATSCRQENGCCSGSSWKVRCRPLCHP